MDVNGINVLTEVPILDDGIPLTPSTKMYVNNELKFRQIPLSRFLDWLKGQLTKAVYPVGSVYTTLSDDNPAALFGGTWEKIEGRFLLGASEDVNAGEVGGEKEVLLNAAEMPTHTHIIGEAGSHYHTATTNTSGNHNHTPSNTNFLFSVNKDFAGTNDDVERVQVALAASGRRAITAKVTESLGNLPTTSTNGGHTHTVTTIEAGGHIHGLGETGGNSPHNNMPPYLVVNLWRRVS